MGGRELSGRELSGRRRIAPLDRGDELLVLGDEAHDARRVPSHGGGRDPLLTVAQRVVLAGQQRIAVGRDDRTVKPPIRDDEAGPTVGQCSLLLGDRVVEAGDPPGASAATLRAQCCSISRRASRTSSASDGEIGTTSAPRRYSSSRPSASSCRNA